LSTHRLRARLDRLERSGRSTAGKSGISAPDFIIEPQLAKSLRNDCRRLDELSRKKSLPSQFGGPITATELEEMEKLRVSIADRARAIGCPASYGQIEARRDSNRLHKLWCKEMSPRSCGGGPLNTAEDAEEAQLLARRRVFQESPEGRALARIFELDLTRFGGVGHSPAEKEEYERLQAMYPNKMDPDDPHTERIEEFRRACAEAHERFK
jgi:hypothetical protein